MSSMALESEFAAKTWSSTGSACSVLAVSSFFSVVVLLLEQPNIANAPTSESASTADSTKRTCFFICSSH